MRRVVVVQRFEKSAFIRSTPLPPEEQLTPPEKELGQLPRQPVQVGEVLLASGVLELKAALLEKESQRSKEMKPERAE
jgi:hypothetical protein